MKFIIIMKFIKIQIVVFLADSSDNNEDRGIEFKWNNESAAKLGFFW